MNGLSAYILFLSLFLFVACDSAKKEFMTPNSNEPVLDVSLDEYSLNGTIIGKTATDISALHDLLIVPLERELNKKRKIELEDALKNKQQSDEVVVAKLHVNENLSFDDFYKITATMGFVGYTTIYYVIGENYKDVFNVKLPTSSTNCICTFFIHRHVPFLRYKYGRYRSKLLLNEILNVKNDFRESEIECFKDYKALDMMLTFYGSKDDITYVVSLNENALSENSSFHGYDYHSFNNQEDLWKFLADVRSKEESFNQKNPPKEIKCAQDLLESQMKILFEKDVLMKDLAPIIKGLNALGYSGDRIILYKSNEKR
jgi:hypothetical protein